MSDEAPQPPATEQAPMTLPQQYDEIYEHLLANDAIVRATNKRIQAFDDQVKEIRHMRHLQVVMLRSHMARLKQIATEELKKLAGVKSLPGFKAQRETRAQFRVRMQAAREAAEKRAREAIAKTGEPQK